MSNSAFRRALASLSHPLSMAAIVVLLINDHLWRKVAPSWLTGKIGDAAWLIFAPFLLAALLAWVWPKREALVGRGSIIGVGAIFALAKTLPEVHALTIKTLAALLGGPIGLRLDPTDLIALPALLIAWWIWQHPVMPVVFRSRRGWLMLAVGAFATMANVGPSTNIGVRCLVDGGSWVAAIAWNSETSTLVYLSDDGGLTWRPGVPGDAQCADPYRPSRTLNSAVPLQVNDSSNSSIQYRLRAGLPIERSSDGGQTWQIDFHLGGEEARIRVLDNEFQLPIGPFDALVHGGNVVVAMGREGVLVRPASGAWQWVSVGPYAVTELNRVDRVVALLSDELRLALVFGLLMFITIIRDRRGAKWSGLFLALAWIASVALCFILKPGYQSWRPTLMGVISPTTYITGAIALLMAAVQVRRAWRDRRRAIGVAALFALAAAIGFALPFILWTQGVMPFYSTATFVALALLLVLTIAGRRCLQRESTVAQTAAV
jgi:hypothetical protein